MRALGSEQGCLPIISISDTFVDRSCATRMVQSKESSDELAASHFDQGPDTPHHKSQLSTHLHLLRRKQARPSSKLKNLSLTRATILTLNGLSRLAESHHWPARASTIQSAAVNLVPLDVLFTAAPLFQFPQPSSGTCSKRCTTHSLFKLAFACCFFVLFLSYSTSYLRYLNTSFLIATDTRSPTTSQHSLLGTLCTYPYLPSHPLTHSLTYQQTKPHNNQQPTVTMRTTILALAALATAVLASSNDDNWSYTGPRYSMTGDVWTSSCTDATASLTTSYVSATGEAYSSGAASAGWGSSGYEHASSVPAAESAPSATSYAVASYSESAAPAEYTGAAAPQKVVGAGVVAVAGLAMLL